MTIYDRITMHLELQGKTRKKLCEDTNISYNTLTSQIHRNSSIINTETVIAIAEYLNVSVEYLITGNKNLILKEDCDSIKYNNDPILKQIAKLASNLNEDNKKIVLANIYILDQKYKDKN